MADNTILIMTHRIIILLIKSRLTLILTIFVGLNQLLGFFYISLHNKWILHRLLTLLFKVNIFI